MLNVFPRSQTAAPADLLQLGEAKWVDLLSPSDAEVSEVEAAFGLRLPTREAVSEIEATSRLQYRDDVFYMSAPLIESHKDRVWDTAPVGFLLSRTVCVTLRFTALKAFDAVGAALAGDPPDRPELAFIALLEEVVDRAADHLESTANELNNASLAIFHPDATQRARLSRDTERLRQVITKVGRASERMSHARYTLVCLARMAQFTADRGHDWLCQPVLERLQGVKADIASLEQFEEHLLSRVQLLQDAASALISIEQNDVVKVLTIASVVGIPPVLVVGVYGMNFKFMPELNWTYGYPYALALVVVSTLIPLIWFKIKDWM